MDVHLASKALSLQKTHCLNYLTVIVCCFLLYAFFDIVCHGMLSTTGIAPYCCPVSSPQSAKCPVFVPGYISLS